MRGIALMLVLCYHYFYRFDEFYPYSPAENFLISHGMLGVHLFFIISGFVIAMTLARSDSFLEFSKRRLSRLWPPMLVCSVITFVFMWLIDTDYAVTRRTSVLGFIPSLTFTDPSIWRWLPGRVDYIDGVYWSLFVEVRFYLLAGLLFFLFPKRNFALIFSAAAIGAWVAYAISKTLQLEAMSEFLNIVFAARFLPLFMAGVVFYEWHSGKNDRRLTAAMMFGLIASFAIIDDLVGAVLVTSFFFLFWLLCFHGSWLRFLCWRPFSAVGVISYSAYLLHQNIGVSLISTIPENASASLKLLSMFLVVASVLLISFLTYRFVEKNSAILMRPVFSIGRIIFVRNKAARG